MSHILKCVSRRTAFCLGAAAFVFACSAWGMALEPSQYEYDPTGWTDLLEGAGPEFKGWVRCPIPSDGAGMSTHFERSQWSFDPKSKVLTCKGDGPHEWIHPDREFGDFLLHVEWRFIPNSTKAKPNYNSGIFFRSSKDGAIWHQAQTGNASGGYVFGDTLVEGKKKRVNLAKEMVGKRVNPAGEWNTYEIRCQGKEVRLWVNGGTTTKWKACEIPNGYLGLEAEGYAIEFKNLMVKKIEAEKSKK